MAVETVLVPPCYAKSMSVGGNVIRQLLIREQQAPLTTIENGRRYTALVDSERTIVITSGRSTDIPSQPFLRASRAALCQLSKSGDISSARWSGARELLSHQEVINSLAGQFLFKADDPAQGVAGLRAPQLGAIHAVLGYWTTNRSDPATVVMPTGTGKTDTMIALFCAASIERLLIVVPSDALRGQIAEKFLELGVLQDFQIVPRSCHRPIVGLIRRGFKSAGDAATFADQCNIMVSTPSALRASVPDAYATLVERCSHLFVDEAHHVTASTWREIRDAFTDEDKRVVQFTATPYREDGRHIGGHFVYAFPLREAQRQRYFSTINYISVLDMGNHDQAIAARAVEQLQQDLANGYDHILMARVRQISRARNILPLYQDLASELAPVILHSQLLSDERRRALDAIRDRTSRIIICVDMLGEGFDLPALKVAAIHDTHKSLGATLQFIGRFARTTGTSLGGATAIVGRPDGPFDPRLRRLYAEDADWNVVIEDLSEGVIGKEHEISEFEAAFGELPEEVSMRSLLPKMSTVIYEVETKEWDLAAVRTLYGEDGLLTDTIAINERDGVAWFVRESRTAVTWGDLRTFEEVTYDLFVLYLDRDRQLLYINSSDNSSVHQNLAEAICGVPATRIVGENVYRVMAQIDRLVPTNVGLLDVRNRSRRFSMHVGADVVEGFPVVEAQTKTKTNIFAYGFDQGDRVSIGASLKGRVWSYRRAASLKHWVDWCNYVGKKMIDPEIGVDDVFRQFIRPETLDAFPDQIPLALEWPWEILANTSDEVVVVHEGKSWPIVDVSLELQSHEPAGPIEFRVGGPHWEVEYTLDIGDGQMHVVATDDDAMVQTRNQEAPLQEFFNSCGLQVILEQDAMIVPPAILLQPDRSVPAFDPDRLTALDWKGIDLRVESQGVDRRPDSIQARAIQHVRSLEEWDVLLDDDMSGEIADIVAMRADADTLHVHLTHCKWVSGGVPRKQVADLYEVCGQAQKSTQWRRNIPLLLQRLIRRQRKRVQTLCRDGFIAGEFRDLYLLEEQAAGLKTAFTIAIAQPGVTQAGVTPAQLTLLASTEVYVYETCFGSFEVYCSP